MEKGRKVSREPVPKWTIDCKSPFARTSASSWSDFLSIIDTYFLDWPEYIFRGQRDAKWALRSRFQREYLQAEERIQQVRTLVEHEEQYRVVHLGTSEQMLKDQLERFKKASLGRRGLAPRELSEDEWWALGRHFGLATPLLDWTRSPYVACFFAMQEAQTSASGLRAVWAFSHSGFREIQNNPSEIFEYGKSYSVVEQLADEIHPDKPDRPSIQTIESLVDENSRALNQNGLFTRTPEGRDIEEFIQSELDLPGAAPILYRIDIAEAQRETFLRQLEAMNIHSGSLFPDLSGAADYCNRVLEKHLYEGEWRQNVEFRRRMSTHRPTHE